MQVFDVCRRSIQRCAYVRQQMPYRASTGQNELMADFVSGA